MLKTNKILFSLYFSLYMQHNVIKSGIQQPLDEVTQDILSTNEPELDEYFNESGDFIMPMIEKRLVNAKKTRYVYLQNRCMDYCIVFFIYYLNLREKWYSFWGKLYKKCHKIIRYLIYCS